jgi:hypothetical protein
MDIFPRLLIVFGLGAVELWAAIPAGFALGLHPITTAIASALGAITSGLVVALLGDRARAWLVARHGSRVAARAAGRSAASGTATGSWGWACLPRCSSGRRWGLPWASSWAPRCGAKTHVPGLPSMKTDRMSQSPVAVP